MEILNSNGEAIEGFRLADMKEEMRGDELGRTVFWNSGADLGKWAGKPVRLRFVMREADLYAIGFVGR